MANQPSSYPILCVSFNQDNSCFAIGTREGFKIFDCNTGRLLYERAAGAFIIVEMLFSSSLLAIVGAGEQPSLSPRRLCMLNTTTGVALEELNFLTSILAVRMNKKRLIVILQEKTFIYDINSLKILDTIDTVPNPKGLCAFSPSLDGSYLALPASTTKGSLLVYNVSDLRLHCEIDAHRAPLSVLTLSSGGTHIATASEQGTMIRVHLVSDATKSYSFRRGTYTSNIFSLSFAPAAELPDILLATSSSGSVHVFSLSSPPNQSSGEEVDHLLLHCPVSSALWRAILNLFGVQWVMPSTVKEMLYSWAGFRRRRKQRAWKFAPLALMWIVWEERNRRAFEGIESPFSHLKNSLLSLIAFWCTHIAPICIKDWASFVENHVLM